MLRGLKYIGPIASGTTSTADLYEMKGKKVVLRTTVIPFEQVQINSAGEYELLYRYSKTSNEYPIIRELMFYELIANMPSCESQYFVKLFRYDITKSPDKDGNVVKFDASRLIPHMGNNYLSEIPAERRIYMRQLLEYAGESVFEMMLHNRDEPIYTELTKSLIEIVRLAKKYKWYIGNIHADNICILNGKTKLVDYWSNFPMANFDNKRSVKINYDSKMMYLNVISVISGHARMFADRVRINEIDVLTEVPNAKCYPEIVKYMNATFAASDHKNFIVQMMKDIKSGAIVSEYQYYKTHISILWMAIDKKSFDKLITSHYPEYEPSPNRASPRQIHQLLAKLLSAR
jgi:hypothetical protein